MSLGDAISSVFGGALLKGLGFSGIALEEEHRPYVKDRFKELSEAKDMPPDIKRVLEDSLKGDKGFGWVAILPYLIGALFGIGSTMAFPALQTPLHKVNRIIEQYRFDPGTITRLWLRGFPDEVRKEDWWEDLKDQAWSEDRIEAAKELAYLLPSPSDIVHWLAREVFEPDSIEKYGLDNEWDKVSKEGKALFGKVGVNEEMAKNHWMAHWVHTSFEQMVELLHRGLLTGEREAPAEPTSKEEWEVRDAEGSKQLYEWYRLVEVTPFWRNLMTEATWNVPTRVDVRRWWDMRTISEEELRSIYHRQGYHGKDLDNYITWTKVYVAFPDLIARYRNGWIPKEQVKNELLQLGMPEARAEEMLETKFRAAASAERVSAERDLTKTDITMAVKKGIMSRETGIDLLERLGYDREEAGYIIDARVAAAGSPETPLEFRELVESYRKSQGLDYKEVPAEVLEKEKELRDLNLRLKEAITQKAPQSELDQLEASIELSSASFSRLLGANEL